MQLAHNFFPKKFISICSTHWVIRANFLCYFCIFIFCCRFWVTFDWSAVLLFSKSLSLIGCWTSRADLPKICNTTWLTQFNSFQCLNDLQLISKFNGWKSGIWFASWIFFLIYFLVKMFKNNWSYLRYRSISSENLQVDGTFLGQYAIQTYCPRKIIYSASKHDDVIRRQGPYRSQT